MEQKQHFTLSIPKNLHEGLVEACERYEHVEEHEGGYVVRPPDGNGLAFRIEPIPHSHEAKVTILENPEGHHIVHVRAKLAADIAEFASTGKEDRYEPAEEPASEPEKRVD